MQGFAAASELTTQCTIKTTYRLQEKVIFYSLKLISVTASGMMELKSQTEGPAPSLAGINHHMSV